MGFDEFIIKKGVYHYLNDEVTNFLELYETIARPGTDHSDVYVYFLANAISVTNPYFAYFNLKPGKEHIYTRGDILLEMVDNQEFIEVKKESRFGKIVNGTKYGDYAINNQFLIDDNNFVLKKSEFAKYLFTLIYNNNKYGVWVDYKSNNMFVSLHTDPYCKLVYSLKMDDHTDNDTLIKNIYKSFVFKTFIENYKTGSLFFESVDIKNNCYEFIKMFLR